MQGIQIEAYTAQDLKEVEIGKKLIEVLAKHYPDHPWCVEVSLVGGHATVQLLYSEGLRLSRLGYLLHLNKLTNSDEIERKLMLAGGELLERKKLHRGRATLDTAMIADITSYDKQGIIR